jgi:hypothetical protein
VPAGQVPAAAGQPGCLIIVTSRSSLAGDLPGQGWAHMFTALACAWKGGWAGAVTLAGQA